MKDQSAAAASNQRSREDRGDNADSRNIAVHDTVPHTASARQQCFVLISSEGSSGRPSFVFLVVVGAWFVPRYIFFCFR